MATKAERGAAFMKIIEEGRQRKKIEERANSILGSGRAQSFSGVPNSRKSTTAGTLASRMGVAKKQAPPRSAAASPVNGVRNGARPNRNLNRTVSDTRLNHRNRALENVTSESSHSNLRNQVNIRDSLDDAGFNIRGNAGPQRTTIVAQNFATGTTAMDIESVMVAISQDVQCRLVASNPTVIAEITFPDQQSASIAVERFNNKMADGHKLYVYLKHSADSGPPVSSRHPPNAPRAARGPQRYEEDDMVDVEIDRQRYDEERRNNARRVEAEYQDGQFDSNRPRYNSDTRAAGSARQARLYSDDLVRAPRARGRFGR